MHAIDHLWYDTAGTILKQPAMLVLLAASSLVDLVSQQCSVCGHVRFAVATAALCCLQDASVAEGTVHDVNDGT